MTISGPGPDIRIVDVRFKDDMLVVDLMDGRTIATPIAWYPNLLGATSEQLANWEIAGAGYGIHWPDLDEDLSSEGMLRGARGVAHPGKPIAAE
ncbi:MAG: DUF2442 domain-containing protein [Hyphomonadaceae bacterium]|nr:DUF2442 domain-containing protein [Hyphomonadaceae bacterium]